MFSLWHRYILMSLNHFPLMSFMKSFSSTKTVYPWHLHLLPMAEPFDVRGFFLTRYKIWPSQIPPEDWSEVKLIPILKKGTTQNDINNFKPIVLLLSCCLFLACKLYSESEAQLTPQSLPHSPNICFTGTHRSTTSRHN